MIKELITNNFSQIIICVSTLSGVFLTLLGNILLSYINSLKDINTKKYNLFKDFYIKRIESHQNILNSITETCDNLHKNFIEKSDIQIKESTKFVNETFFKIRAVININRLWSDEKVIIKATEILEKINNFETEYSIGKININDYFPIDYFKELNIIIFDLSNICKKKSGIDFVEKYTKKYETE
jgi:hypothetical protein